MSDLTEAQIARLAQNAETGKIIRAWCLHPGYAIYKKALEERLTDKKNNWLKGTDEEDKLELLEELDELLELEDELLLDEEEASPTAK